MGESLESRMKKKRYPLVEVTWRDSASNHGWYKEDEFPEASLVEVKTMGYLIRRNARELAMAQSVSEHGKFNEIWVVPAKSVRRVRRLR